ncbi:hypothetical protein AGOR_G00207470 [Albula goreensis]|uniref:Ig-like domain-containing protein n=1 Tax=Albula goreensis TaxID=1534307 RepID=A0A8T3CSY2_9TELE|nr:hypothetical protein AGOR_G00207470 [Albula goreensis]
MLLLAILLGTTVCMTGVQCQKDEVLVEAGSLAVLPCTTGTPPQTPVSVQWVKINGRVQNTVWRIEQSGLEFRGVGPAQRSRCPHSEFGKGDFNLHIEGVRPEDGGEYICRVSRGGWEEQKHVFLWVIQVSVSPPLPLEGSEVAVACNVTPWPDRASVSWKHDGTPVSQQQKQRRAGNTKEQKILSVSPQDVGNWTCTVRLRGKEGKATQMLSMRGISSPLKDMTPVYAAVGSSAVLPCVYTKGLALEKTSWERKQNGESSFNPVLRPPIPSPTRPQWDHSLWLESVEQQDEGIYRCSGEVEGRILQRHLLLVTAQVRSMVPVKPNAPVTLTCDVSNDTGVTGYEWVRVTYDLNGTQTVNGKQKSKTLKIQKMTEEFSGEWVCRYSGKHGILGNASYHLHLMSRLEGEQAGGSSSKGPMAVGLCFLVFVLLLIGLQMYKNHRRRKMILQYPALETIVHSTSNAREKRERNRVREKEQVHQTEI